MKLMLNILKKLLLVPSIILDCAGYFFLFLFAAIFLIFFVGSGFVGLIIFIICREFDRFNAFCRS